MNNIILKTDPFKAIEPTEIKSYFNGVHKPIFFVFERQDIKGVSYSDDGGFIKVTILGDTVPDTDLIVGNIVNLLYINVDNDIIANKEATITAITTSLGFVVDFTTDEAYVSIAPNQGFINIVRENWYLETSIKGFPALSEEVVATIETKSDQNFLVSFNVAPFLKQLVLMEETNVFLTEQYVNKPLSYLYRIESMSYWSGGNGINVENFDENDFFYYINGVKQNLEKYGNNFADFLQNTEIEGQKLFTGLKNINTLSTIQKGLNYYYGFPISFHFIMKVDALFNEKINKTVYDINGNILYNNSFNIDNDGFFRTFNLTKTFLTAYPTAAYFRIYTFYEEILNPANKIFSSLTYQYDVNFDCLEGIYLSWLNSDSSRSYWLFNNKSFHTITAENNTNFKPYSSDIETQNFDIIELDNSANEIISVGGIVTFDKWEQLQSLFYSLNVEILTNPETWETDGAIFKRVRIEKGTLRQWISNDENVEFEFKIILEQINIQAQ